MLLQASEFQDSNQNRRVDSDSTALIVGGVMHSRLYDKRHAFNYDLFFARFDVDKLSETSEGLKLFSFNSFGLLSIYGKDYLEPTAEDSELSLRERVQKQLDSHGITLTPARIELVTGMRLFGYSFTPVSFFLCFDPQNNLSAMIAYVTNTFSESHLYVVSDSTEIEKNVRGYKRRYRRFLCKKNFHVSPFFGMDWQYEFLVASDENGVDIWVNLEKDNKTEFFSEMWGRAVRFDDLGITKILIKYPFSAVLNLPRIMIQAAKLKFIKGLPVFTRPEPQSLDTVRRRAPSIIQRFCMAGCDNILSQIPNGALTVELPGGLKHSYGDPASGINASIKINDLSFFSDILLHGDIGFGDAYVRGAWQSPDLTALLKLAAVNSQIMSSRFANAHWLSRPIRLAKKYLRRNSRTGSKKNIYEHYDLGNNFYRLMLDRTMMYSAALFETKEDSLEIAQHRKIDRLLDGLNLNSSSHLLEIGSGWGELAKRAAERFGCKVTSVTISQQQLAWAKEKIEKAGLSQLVELQFKDYRDIRGEFDAIVSVEMIEAVGEKYLRGFLSQCSRLLKPGGRFALQSITMADDKYEDYCGSEDWIQRRIFPGGHLPSLSHLQSLVSTSTELSIRDVFKMGLHYSETLRRWRSTFNQHVVDVRALGFDDRFIRTWEYYLCYCEAGFETGLIDDLQLLLEKR